MAKTMSLTPLIKQTCYFHSVFSTPKTGIVLPDVSVKSDNMPANIVFSEIDVINVLKGLDVNKGSSPDDIPL